jgi:hypothetical protein
MSSIQSTDMLRTPQSPTLRVSIPPSEETLANADGMPLTISITFDQTTIESSSLASPIVIETAQYNIELSDDVLNLESYTFGKSILLGSENTC